MSKFYLLLLRLFTTTNVCKALIIFIVGFILRILVNSYLDVNVFADFLNYVSIGYYFLFSFFIVFVHETVPSLPSFSYLLSKTFTFILENFEFEGFKSLFTSKVWSIIKSIFHDLIYNYEKLTMNDRVTIDKDSIYTSALFPFSKKDNLLSNNNSSNKDLIYNSKSTRNIIREGMKPNLGIKQNIKCKFYWIFMEDKKKNPNLSYDEFKCYWDIDKDVSKDIKNKIDKRFSDFKDEAKLQVRTFKWLLGFGRNR